MRKNAFVGAGHCLVTAVAMPPAFFCASPKDTVFARAAVTNQTFQQAATRNHGKASGFGLFERYYFHGFRRYQANYPRMIRYPTALFFLAALLSFPGCRPSTSGTTTANGTGVVARAGGETLYSADIRDMVPKDASRTDSLAFVRRYAEAWVRKHLLLARAQDAAQADAGEIAQKTAEYRQYLQLQSFKKQYVGRNLDTTVTEPEIAGYYRAYPENFVLQQPVVRAWLATVPKSAPNLARARNWMRGNGAKQRQELQSYCYRFAQFYHLDDSSWVKLDELVMQTPFRETLNRTGLPKANQFAETADDQNVYLLAVKEARLSSQTAPLPFVRQQIRELVINKRKVALIQEMEKKVYEEARKAKSFEILVR